MNVKRIFCIILGIVVFWLLISCYESGKLEKSIIKYIDDNYKNEDLLINIADFTNFEWDRVMIYKYPTSADEIEKELGVQYEKSLDLTSGMIFVLGNEIVYELVFENNYTEAPRFFIYPQPDINDTPNYRIFSKEEAIFVGQKIAYRNGFYYSLYPYVDTKTEQKSTKLIID